jgi:hypothetical protein
MRNATMIKYKTGESLPDIIDADQLDKETPPQKDSENIGQSPSKKGNLKNSPEKGSSKSKAKLKENTSVNVKDSASENDLKLENKSDSAQQDNKSNCKVLN